jgi:hypothetical protein
MVNAPAAFNLQLTCIESVILQVATNIASFKESRPPNLHVYTKHVMKESIQVPVIQ